MVDVVKQKIIFDVHPTTPSGKTRQMLNTSGGHNAVWQFEADATPEVVSQTLSRGIQEYLSTNHAKKWSQETTIRQPDSSTTKRFFFQDESLLNIDDSVIETNVAPNDIEVRRTGKSHKIVASPTPVFRVSAPKKEIKALSKSLQETLAKI